MVQPLNPPSGSCGLQIGRGTPSGKVCSRGDCSKTPRWLWWEAFREAVLDYVVCRRPTLGTLLQNVTWNGEDYTSSEINWYFTGLGSPFFVAMPRYNSPVLQSEDDRRLQGRDWKRTENLLMRLNWIVFWCSTTCNRSPATLMRTSRIRNWSTCPFCKNNNFRWS